MLSSQSVTVIIGFLYFGLFPSCSILVVLSSILAELSRISSDHFLTTSPSHCCLAAPPHIYPKAIMPLCPSFFVSSSPALKQPCVSLPIDSPSPSPSPTKSRNWKKSPTLHHPSNKVLHFTMRTLSS